MQPKILRPDSKGRITLGPVLTQGVSGFKITETKDHKIILEPYAEIPAHEKWLFTNKTALNQVEQGLKEAGQGKVVSKGGFAKHLDDEF